MKTLFTPGGCPLKVYKHLKKQAPNCTCTYDDYDERLMQHADCQVHGETCVDCTKEGKPLLRAECPLHGGGRQSPGEAHIGFAPSRIPDSQQGPTFKPGGYAPPPKHYDGKGIDPWAVWDAFDLDRYTANAVKYLLRAGKKDIAPRLDDLRKAANYVAKAIEMEEKREADQGS